MAHLGVPDFLGYRLARSGRRGTLAMQRFEAQANVVYDNEVGQVVEEYLVGSTAARNYAAQRDAAARNKEEQDRAAIDHLMRSNRSLCG